MKVAIVTSSAPYGKGESFVISEVNALADAGVEVVLLPVFIRTEKKFTLHSMVTLIAKKHFALDVLVAFLRGCAKQPYKVISAYLSILTGRPINILKNTLVFPKAIWLYQIVLDHNVEHIHAHWATTPATVVMLASQLSGVPWSMTVHRGDLVSNNLLCSKIIKSTFTRFISRSGIRIAQKTCNQEIKPKIRLLHMGVSIPQHLPLAEKTKHKAIILCPANLNQVKGHRFLLEAIQKINTKRDYELHLAGSGPLQASLKKLVTDLKIQHLVKFLGHIQHKELIDLYKNGCIKMVVLPSLDLGNGIHEGIPVSLMEAMAHSVPVIATSTGGIPELLGEGAGILVPHSDSTALAEAIESLLGDGVLSVKQGERGREKVSESFNLATILQTLIDWYET